jgi:TonB family protein
MSPPIQARYCDGETLRSHLVELCAAEDGLLHLTGESVARSIPAFAVKISPSLGRVPRFLRLPDGGVIEVPANPELDAVLAAAHPPSRWEKNIHWLESRAAIAASSTIILAVAVATTVWQGLPRLARRAAYSVPESIETQAGKTGYKIFAQSFAASGLGYAEQRRVQRQLTRLEAARTLHLKPTLAFLSMKTPNAFALPGGTIVVTDELVNLAGSDEELAAVLAHEVGHIEKRHGLQSVLRSSSALIVVSTITGDLSTLTTFSGTLPFILLQYGYAREFEREADDYAIGLLRDAHIDPVNLARILRRLERERPPKTGNDFSYLSSHPATEERVKFVQSYSSTPLPWSASGKADSSPALADVRSPGSLDQLPRATFRQKPAYPFAMRLAGINGDVTVEFIVDTEGRVRNATVVRSSRPEFEDAALQAVRQWTFKPGMKHGRPVNTRMQQPISFSLDDTPAPKK